MSGTPLGQKIAAGTATLEEMAAFAAESPDELSSWMGTLRTMLDDINERKKRQQMSEGVTVLKEGWADLKDESTDGEGSWEGHWFALNSAGELDDGVAMELLPPSSRWLVGEALAPLWAPAMEKLGWIAQRTAFIDEAVDAFLASGDGEAQVVLLGSGLLRRDPGRVVLLG